MSTLAGRRITTLDGIIPPAGGFRFSGRLDSGEPLAAGPASLVIGDLTIAGAVLDGRGGQDAPALPAFIFAGGDGWRTKLPAGVYKSPAGVRLSTVLADLSRLCGEAFDAPPEVRLGPEYGWDAGTRGRVVLADLVARGVIPTWRVDPATARTRFDAWPTLGAADTQGRITSRDLSRGCRMVALADAVAAFLPGSTLQGVTTARLTLHEAEGMLRAEVYDA